MNALFNIVDTVTGEVVDTCASMREAVLVKKQYNDECLRIERIEQTATTKADNITVTGKQADILIVDDLDSLPCGLQVGDRFQLAPGYTVRVVGEPSHTLSEGDNILVTGEEDNRADGEVHLIWWSCDGLTISTVPSVNNWAVSASWLVSHPNVSK